MSQPFFDLGPRFALWPVRMPEIRILGNEKPQELWDNRPIFVIDRLDNRVYDGMKIWYKDMLCSEVEKYEMGEYVGEWTGCGVRFK